MERQLNYEEDAMGQRDKQTSVYPGEPASTILCGFSSTRFNQAIRCWAQLIARQTVELAGALDGPEWWCLADALRGIEITPDIESPGKALAESLEARNSMDPTCGRWFNENASDRVEGLARKLGKMDYAAAWAVIVAIQFFWVHRAEIKDMDLWWTIPYRRLRIEASTKKG